MNRFPSINDVADLLGLERDPRSRNDEVYNVRCPFCQGPGEKKYKMNINSIKGVYHCYKCSDGKLEGTLDLYARVKHNTRCIKGVNSREMARMLLNDLGWINSPEADRIRAQRALNKTEHPEQKYNAVVPAEDAVLDRAYSALLSLPYMSLSKKHVCSLLGRGLDFNAVRQNGYGTVRSPEDWITEHPSYEEMLDFAESETLRQFVQNNPGYGEIKKNCLIAGLLAGKDLQRLNVNMERVPGFFTVCGHWCFNIAQGMLIPTRNMKGQIVACQIRRDTVRPDGCRYMTVSSRGFEGGPNEQILRTHFPLGNAGPENNKTPVILTEGPLKADVAAHLFGRPSFFIAVPGVNSLRELPEIAAVLKAGGVDHALCAYDMDRISNVYVYRAEKKAREIFSQAGITLHEYLWQKELITDYRKRICRYYEENDLMDLWTEQNSDLETVFAAMEGLLKYSKEGYLRFKNENSWNGCKGIDDYLLARRTDK